MPTLTIWRCRPPWLTGEQGKAKTGEEEEQRSTVREKNPKIEVVVWRLGREKAAAAEPRRCRRRIQRGRSKTKEEEGRADGWFGRGGRLGFCKGRRRWKR